MTKEIRHLPWHVKNFNGTVLSLTKLNSPVKAWCYRSVFGRKCNNRSCGISGKESSMKTNDVSPARVAFVIERLVLLSSPLRSRYRVRIMSQKTAAWSTQWKRKGLLLRPRNYLDTFHDTFLRRASMRPMGLSCVSSVDLLCNVRIKGKCIAEGWPD